MKNVAPPLRVLLRVAIVAAVVLALIVVATSTRSGVLWRLSTFTYQANLLAAAFFACTLVSKRADALAGLRGAVVVYVVIAGVVWTLFLTEHSMGYTPANLLLHIVVPVFAVAEWLLATHGRVLWWYPIAWLAYPAAYLTVALVVLNHAGRRAPYYFLDPQSVGTAAVAGNIALLAAIFLGVGYLLMTVADRSTP